MNRTTLILALAAITLVFVVHTHARRNGPLKIDPWWSNSDGLDSKSGSDYESDFESDYEGSAPKLDIYEATSNVREHASARAEVRHPNHSPIDEIVGTNLMSVVDEGDLNLIRGGSQDPGAVCNDTDINLINGCQDVGAMI